MLGDAPGRKRDLVQFVLPVLLIYAVVVLLVTSFHEPFTDEADAWLAARDLPLSQLLNFTRHVGNPAALYLILMPLAKLKAPYQSMLWVHAAIAIAAAAVFLTWAPFSRLTRALVVLGFYTSYQYAAIARNYVLLMLMLFVTAAWYPQRRHRPIGYAICVFLLFQTTAHGALLAALISGAFFFGLVHERTLDRRRWGAFLIMIAGAALVAAQLWPPADPQLPGVLIARNPESVYETMTRAIAVPFGSGLFDPLWLLFNSAIVAVTVIYLISRPDLLALLIGGLGALFYIFVFKWCVPARHAGLLELWVIFVLWLREADIEPGTSSIVSRLFPRFRREHLYRLLRFALFASCIQATVAWEQEYRTQYSHGKQMGMVIASKGWDREPIASTYVAESVLPYIHSRTYYSLHLRRNVSFNTWDWEFAQNGRLGDSEVWKRVHDIAAKEPEIQVLWNWPLPYPERNGYRLVYSTKGAVGPSNEVFYFYQPLNRTR